MRSWHTLSLLELNQISVSEDIKVDSVRHSALLPYHQYALAYHFNTLGLVSDFVFLQQASPEEEASFLPPLEYKDIVLYVNKEQADKTWACLKPILFTEDRHIKQVIVSNPQLSRDMTRFLSAQMSHQKNTQQKTKEQEEFGVMSRESLLDESHMKTYEENENYLKIFISVDITQREDLMSVIHKVMFEEYVDPIYLEILDSLHVGLPDIFHQPQKSFYLEDLGQMGLFRHDVATRTLYSIVDIFDELPGNAWVFFKAWFDIIYEPNSELSAEQDSDVVLEKLILLALDNVINPVRDARVFVFNCHVIRAFLSGYAEKCQQIPQFEHLQRCYDFRLEADMFYQEYNLRYDNAEYKKRDERDDYDYEAINPLLKNIASKVQCLLFVSNEAEYQEIKQGFEANRLQARARINPELPALTINQRLLLFRTAQKFDYFDEVVEKRQIKPWTLRKL